MGNDPRKAKDLASVALAEFPARQMPDKGAVTKENRREVAQGRAPLDHAAPG